MRNEIWLSFLLLNTLHAEAWARPAIDVDGIYPGMSIASVEQKLGEPWYNSLTEVLWGPRDAPIRLVRMTEGRVWVVNGKVLHYRGRSLRAGVDESVVFQLLGKPACKKAWSNQYEDWSFPQGTWTVVARMRGSELKAVSVRVLHHSQKRIAFLNKAKLRFRLGQRASFNFKGMTRPMAIKQIAEAMGFDIYLGPGLEERRKFDLALDRVTPAEAISAVLPAETAFCVTEDRVVYAPYRPGMFEGCGLHQCLFGPCSHEDW